MTTTSRHRPFGIGNRLGVGVELKPLVHRLEAWNKKGKAVFKP